MLAPQADAPQIRISISVSPFRLRSVSRICKFEVRLNKSDEGIEMKGKSQIIGIAILATLSTLGANATEDHSPAESQLLKAVLQLRADVLELLLEARQANVRGLQRELEQLHVQQRRVRQAEEERVQQATQVEQQLSSPDLESGMRVEVEAVKRQLTGDSADKLRAEESAMQQHEADLLSQIENELQNVKALQQRAAQVQKALRD
jgi:hypothetical protein